MKISFQPCLVLVAALNAVSAQAQGLGQVPVMDAIDPHALPNPEAYVSAAAPDDKLRNADLPDFSQADKDGDGVLSVAEAREVFPQAVVIVDADNDGILSREEAEKAVAGLAFAPDEAGQGGIIGKEDYERIKRLLMDKERG